MGLFNYGFVYGIIYMYGPYSFLCIIYGYIYSVYIYYFTLYKTIQDRCLPTCKLVCKQSN